MAERTGLEWETIARRLLVLGNYGYDTSLLQDRIDDPDFLTDDWLVKWYGMNWAEEYVLDELNSVNLIMSMKTGALHD